jgi:hypothetical protein
MALLTRAQLKALWVQGYKPTESNYDDVWDSFSNLSDDGYSEPKIYIPSTQPDLTLGTPNTLVLDIDSNRQAMFEPQKETGVTQSIDVDFTLSFLNSSSALLISTVFQLSGTRTITMPLDVLVSNASSIGTWIGGGTQTLELSTGTADIIELQFLRYLTTSKWLLKVSEIAI